MVPNTSGTTAASPKEKSCSAESDCFCLNLVFGTLGSITVHTWGSRFGRSNGGKTWNACEIVSEVWSVFCRCWHHDLCSSALFSSLLLVNMDLNRSRVSRKGWALSRYCPLGFILPADINECTQFGSCPQICHNTKGSYECSCAEGFTSLSDRYGERCAADGMMHWRGINWLSKTPSRGLQYTRK